MFNLQTPVSMIQAIILYIHVYIQLGHWIPGINGVHPIVRHLSDAVVKTELFRSQKPHRQGSFEAMEAVKTCWVWGQVLCHILIERGTVGKTFTWQFQNIVLILVMHDSRAVSSQICRFVPATCSDEKVIIMTGKYMASKYLNGYQSYSVFPCHCQMGDCVWESPSMTPDLTNMCHLGTFRIHQDRLADDGRWNLETCVFWASGRL